MEESKIAQPHYFRYHNIEHSYLIVKVLFLEYRGYQYHWCYPAYQRGGVSKDPGNYI